MNTFFNIRQIKTEQSFKNRLSHNNRKSNLKNGPVPDKEFKNISLIDERKNLRNLLNDEKKFNKSENKNELSKSQISKKISRIRDRIKNSKKEKTKEKLTKDLNELLNLREKTESKKVGKPKNNFFEIDMSITSIDRKELLRDKDFANDFLTVYLEFIKSRFENAEIISLNGHLDQSNPHAHLNLLYIGDNSITRDLENIYGKSPKNYKKLQLDFNKFVKEHNLIKKHNLKIGNIGDNGKVKYIKAANYKLLQKRAKKQANGQVNDFIDRLKNKYKDYLNFNKDKVIEDLSKSLINQRTKSIEVKLGATYFTKLEKEIVKLTDEKDSIFQEVNEDFENRLKEIEKDIKPKFKEMSQNLKIKDSEINILKKRSQRIGKMEMYLKRIGHTEKFEDFAKRPHLTDIKNSKNKVKELSPEVSNKSHNSFNR